MSDKKIEKQIETITKALIKFETIKDKPEELLKCADYIKSKLSNRLYIKTYLNKGKPSIVATVNNTKKPKLYLTGHFDVVEAEKDQFKPKTKGNKLYGRGAVDMKSGVAAIIALINNTDQDIGAIFTSDEEIGGEHGMGFLVAHGYLSKFVISPEPTHMQIKYKSKGVFWINISTKGKAAHGSRPDLGKNAIEILMKKFEEIKKLFNYKPNKWTTSVNLGYLHSGTALNRVPDYAEMGLDIRYVETDKPNQILKRLKKIKDIDIKIIENQSQFLTDEKDKHIELLKEAGKSVDIELETDTNTGASDIRYFTDKKIPSVDFGPLGHNIHGIGEYVEMKSVYKWYDIMQEFLKRI